MPWTLDPSEHTVSIERTGSGLEFSWSQEDPGSHILHTIVHYYPQTSGTPSPLKFQTLALRIACHYLLDRIPEDGIPELCEAVGRIYEFYNSRPTTIPHKSITRAVRARRGQVYERPEFVIDEE